MEYSGVIECFSNLGIVVEEENNFYLRDYIGDSMTHISFIVELEQKFGIEISDEYLQAEALETMQDVVNMIEHLKATL